MHQAQQTSAPLFHPSAPQNAPAQLLSDEELRGLGALASTQSKVGAWDNPTSTGPYPAQDGVRGSVWD
jgi:hypothetical protein